MDLELSDEQRWLSESIDTLLHREWLAPEALGQADESRRRRVWTQLVGFGALSIGPDGIGAIEACLIARSLGAHLAAAPFLDSAALRLALAPVAGELADDLARLVAGEDAVALAVLEPGCSWAAHAYDAAVHQTPDGRVLRGEKVAVEQLELADVLAVAAALDDEPGLVLVGTHAPGILASPRESFDRALTMSAVEFAGVPVGLGATLAGPLAGTSLARLRTAGALLAAAEAIGAASRILDEACRFAGQRRQFGRRIAGFQAVRHLLADMYVRCASGWSSVLYAAAAFDDGTPEAQQTASVAKAYVARGAREVAHGAMQVFGGIAFTDEHPAHHFLRRIVVRERQFGDAAHHERVLGDALARIAAAPAAAPTDAALTV